MKTRPILLALALLLCGAFASARAQDDGVPRITLSEFKSQLASANPPFVIDVRANIDAEIKGAHHIPLADIEARLNEIPRDRAIVTYCS